MKVIGQVAVPVLIAFVVACSSAAPQATPTPMPGGGGTPTQAPEQPTPAGGGGGGVLPPGELPAGFPLPVLDGGQQIAAATIGDDQYTVNYLYQTRSFDEIVSFYEGYLAREGFEIQGRTASETPFHTLLLSASRDGDLANIFIGETAEPAGGISVTLNWNT